MLQALAALALTAVQTTVDLPDQKALESYKPSTNVHAVDTAGKTLFVLGKENREWVALGDIPQTVIDAFLAAEDSRFFQHGGVDPVAIARAALQNVKSSQGTRLIGGSTITQQLAKQVFVGNDRTYMRKAREAIVSRELEQSLSKEQILELYLNEVYLGKGAYGVKVAAKTLFNKPLRDLNYLEAATMASLVKAPSSLSATKNRKRLRARRNWVLDQLLANKKMSFKDVTAQRGLPLELYSGSHKQPRIDSYYEDLAHRDLLDLFGQERLDRGGFTVTLAIDSTLQSSLEDSMAQALLVLDRPYKFRGPIETKERQKGLGAPASWELTTTLTIEPDRLTVANAKGETCVVNRKASDQPKVRSSFTKLFERGDRVFIEKKSNNCLLRQVPEISGASIAIDPATGKVLAVTGGFDFAVSQYNRAAQAFRQPGSTIKPLTYLAALNSGYEPNDLIVDEKLEIELPGNKIWSPRNSDNRFKGEIPLEQGLYLSRNVPTLRLAQELGFRKIWDYATYLGLSYTMPREWTITLGSASTTVVDLSGAYATMLQSGRLVVPYTVDKVIADDGALLAQPSLGYCPECKKSSRLSRRKREIAETGIKLDPVASKTMSTMLRKVVSQGTAYRVGRTLPKDVIAKTGTTNDFRDAWFVAQTKSLTGQETLVSTYIGFDTPVPIARGATGARVAAPIFKDLIQQVRYTKALNKATSKGVVNYKQHYVTTTVNFRATPSLKGKKIGRITKSKAVALSACKNGWCQVSFDGKNGYVFGQYVASRTVSGNGTKMPEKPSRYRALGRFVRDAGGTYKPNPNNSAIVSANGVKAKRRKPRS